MTSVIPTKLTGQGCGWNREPVQCFVQKHTCLELNPRVSRGLDIWGPSFFCCSSYPRLIVMWYLYHRYRLFLCACSVAQHCLTLRNPMACSPPGCSVHGIFQARMPEWDPISSSRGSSQPTDQTCVSCIGRWFLYHYARRETHWFSLISNNDLVKCLLLLLFLKFSIFFITSFHSLHWKGSLWNDDTLEFLNLAKISKWNSDCFPRAKWEVSLYHH